MVPTETIIYYILQTITMITLPALTLTFLLSNGVRRHATITNSMVVWTMRTLAASLQFFSGNFLGKPPSHALCQAQSIWIAGSIPAISATWLGIVVPTWYLTWSVDRAGTFLEKRKCSLDRALVIAPWLVWASISLMAGLLGQPRLRGPVCVKNDRWLARTNEVVVALFLLAACVFQAWTVILVLRRYRSSRRLSSSELGQIELGLFVRILLFSILSVFGFALALVHTAMSWPPSTFVVAVIGPLNFVIFGSQSDVLRCWGLSGCLDRGLEPSTDAGLERHNTPPNAAGIIGSGRRAIQFPLTLKGLRGRSDSPYASSPGAPAPAGHSTCGMDALHTLEWDAVSNAQSVSAPRATSPCEVKGEPDESDDLPPLFRTLTSSTIDKRHSYDLSVFVPFDIVGSPVSAQSSDGVVLGSVESSSRPFSPRTFRS